MCAKDTDGKRGATVARTRVFISSTFYDLKYIRADLELFVRELGYEPILNERGSIAYGSEEKLEEYAYQEVDLSDIVVCIIGGRYGTGSQQEPYSISQMELRRAVENGKQVYIFVEKSVHAEYGTYLMNRTTADIKYRHVDNTAVYAFLEEVEALPKNNPMASFETSRDIIEYLKLQWSGLFQRFLSDHGRSSELNVLKSMQSTAETLDNLVQFLTTQTGDASSQPVQDILIASHPAFERLRSLLAVPYRVFFTTHDELAAWLPQRSFKPSVVDWDEPDVEEWLRITVGETYQYLHISTKLFGSDGKLLPMTSKEWNDELIWLETVEVKQDEDDDDDDDKKEPRRRTAPAQSPARRLPPQPARRAPQSPSSRVPRSS